MRRIIDKSPDDASQKSKKKRKAPNKTLSIGRTSQNDSVMEGLSASMVTQSNFNESQPKLNQSQANIVFQKAKPRDFVAHPIALVEINAHNYDKLEDMGQIQINVEKALEKLKSQWK